MSKQAGKASASARVHTQQSNRKARDPNESKTVFRAVLDNPFHIKWPQIPSNVENAILAQAIQLLEGVAEYNLKRRNDNRERKKAKSKDVEMEDAGDEVAQDDPSSIPVPDEAESSIEKTGESSRRRETEPPLSAPEILKAVSVGINDVTKRLEAQSRAVFSPPTETISAQRDGETVDAGMVDADVTTKTDASTPRSPIRAVLVCKADIDPPMLINHIPYLVASCNSKVGTNGEPVRLVTLPKGAELALAQAFGLRRAAVVALHEEATTDPMLKSLLVSVQPVVAPWVVAPLPVAHALKDTPKTQRKLVHNRKELLPTNIKQIRTTMPKDMKQHKAKRAKERAEAKARRKERMKKGVTEVEKSDDGAVAATTED